MGMCELVERVYKEHNVSKVMYIGGFVEHEDTQKRLRAVMDVSKKYGITIDDEYIIFADWAKALAMTKLAEWCKNHDEIPDVVFCANDIMARGVIEQFEHNGYMVPDDVLVTGYDCTKLGQQREPSLMTVKHDYKSMGYAAMSILSDKMNGIDRNESVVIGSQVLQIGITTFFDHHRPGAGTLRIRIMANNQFAVSGQMHVTLHAIGSAFPGKPECRQRIFRRIPTFPAM